MNSQKILVVDDDAVVSRGLSVKLKAQGYEVLTASDGSEAVSTVRRDKPDLIILDITFPPDVAHGGGVPWDGFLIIQWLRRLDEGKNIPIIVITGGDALKYQDRALAAGAVAFYHKPVDDEELFGSIRDILAAKSPADSVPGT
jgi:CheY-like chemotaxis protein